MTIYITGDTHGDLDLHKLSNKSMQKKLTEEDIVIICGDFGLVWSNPPKEHEIYWLDWLSKKPFTTLFIRGNHENHDLLDQLPTKQMYGGEVGVVREKVYELKTGHIYNINNKDFFVFGGAESIDKSRRVMGVSWWSGEIPTMAQFNLAWDNLEANNREVDYILTHTCPYSLVPFSEKMNDPTTKMLESFIETIKYEKWFCGHFHINKELDKIHFLYEDIVKVNI
jgi:predicted phosphodiesterase